MKKHLLPCLFILLCFNGYSQCLVPGGPADTSFPVTNTLALRHSSDGWHYVEEGGISRMAKVGDTLYVLGIFTNLGPSHGRGVVLDATTRSRETTAQWKIDGTVNASVPDGRGGFYIGGSFTHIGDSSRPFLAQIDAYGRPTSWKPQVDSTVHALYLKNDTLFIGGAFTRVNEQARKAFAVYSLAGDTLMHQQLPFEVSNYVTVYVFKPHGDSLFIGGRDVSIVGVDSKASVIQYNTRLLKPTNWTINTYHFDNNINSIEVSAANRVLFYGHLSHNNLVAVDLLTGEEKYRLTVTSGMSTKYGMVYALKTIGNKLWVGGNFDHVYLNGTKVARKGLCVLDLPTKSLLPVDLQLNNAVRYLEAINDKLYISGYFTSIGGIAREHFAELDTATLLPGEWNPAPSDPVLTLSTIPGKLFMGGEFNGLHSVHRAGLAAIDVRTGAILPFNPLSDRLNSISRIVLQGEYLYILHNHSTITRSQISRINRYTGAITDLLPVENFYDFNVDSSYLYAADTRGLVRYRLHDLQQLYGWGWTNPPWSDNILLSQIIVKDDKLYGLNNRSLLVLDKATGNIVKEWHYFTDNDPHYSQFQKGVLSGDSILYVLGPFDQINGQPRKNFVAIDVRTGAVTPWHPTFTDNGWHYSEYLPFFSPLYLKDNKVWFGHDLFNKISDGRDFWGLGAIDDSTGVLMPPSISVKGAEDDNGSFHWQPTSVSDIVFDKEAVYVGGYFDKTNGGAFRSLARFSYQNSPSLPTLSSIVGRDTLFSGSDSNRYVLDNAPLEGASYYWTYSGDSVEIKNNGGNTVWLQVGPGATGGVLKARAQNYCGLGSEVQKTIVLVNKRYADLSLSSVTATPQNVPQASTFTVQFTLVNSGDAPSKASQVSFYLSKDAELTPNSNGDLLLGVYDGTAPVAANDSITARSVALKAPCTLGTGTFYLFAVADAQNIEEESNKVNNKSFTLLYISEGETMPFTPAIYAKPSAWFCAGDSIQLSLLGTPNATHSYTWSTGETTTSITVKRLGTYTLTATNSCGSASASVYVSERTRPDATVTASGATTFCAGGRVTLNVAPTYNSTYQWNLNGAPIAGATAASYTATTSGRYTVTKTYNSCPAVSTEIVVTVNDVPVKPVITASGNVLSSSANSGVQWFKEGVALPGATGATYTATASGQYSVSTTQNGCSATSEPYNFVLTAIVDVRTWNGEVSAYPNPMNDQLFIANKAGRRLSVQLVDANGKSVYEGMFSGPLATISTNNLAAGSYILLITDMRKGETISRVAVKQ